MIRITGAREGNLKNLSLFMLLAKNFYPRGNFLFAAVFYKSTCPPAVITRAHLSFPFVYRKV